MVQATRPALQLALVALVIATADLGPARAQSANALYALNRQVVQLHQQGQNDKAVVIAKRALAMAERLRGPHHPDVAICLVNLTTLYAAQDRFSELEPLLQRLLSIREKTLHQDHPDVEQSLNNLALIYSAQGRAAEAEPFLRRSLAIREKTLGPDHPDVADSLSRLAAIYRGQDRHGEAEPLFRRALAIREKALGPDHADVAATLHDLAMIHAARGGYADAETLYKRSLAIREMVLGPEHADVRTSLNNLAWLYGAQARYEEAEPLARRALAIDEKRLGSDHPDVAIGLNNLAVVYTKQGRYGEAEPLLKRSLSVRETVFGPNHAKVATSLNNLAMLYVHQGRFIEAEPLYRRSLVIAEKALGPDHTDYGGTLNNLADLYEFQGRHAEAEPLFKRAVAIFEKVFGPDHPDVGTGLDNLAGNYASQGRHADAEPLYERSIAIRAKALGPDHPSVGQSLNNLAELYKAQNRSAEAEPLLTRTVSILEKALGPEHPHVGRSLRNLAGLYLSLGRLGEAEPLFLRSLSIQERALGSDHPDVGVGLGDLASLFFAQQDWMKAARYWQQSTEILIRRSKRGTETIGAALTGGTKSEASRASYQFRGLLRISYRLFEAGRADAGTAHRMFQTAQWAQSSEAAQSLAQMAARQAKGSDTLAGFVRERQDLVAEWQAKDRALTAARAAPPALRNAEAEARLGQRLAAIDARVAEIDTTLKTGFPNYAALSNPEPLSVEEVQAALHPDEALVLFLDTPQTTAFPEETFVWIVTKTDLRWVRSELGTPSLAREVAALRCGLDYYGAWTGSRCFDLTGEVYTGADHRAGNALPYDLARAHKLYRALFAEVADLIGGKHLLIVPSGPLTQLSFHALVTEAPDPAITGLQAMRQARWLMRSHALTVLPAVSSLTALRRDAKPSRAPNPYLGIGNPLLDGPNSQYAGLAKQARERQTCSTRTGQRVADIRGPRGGVSQVATRGGLVDVAHVRVQTPLPETSDELCAVAQSLGVGVDHVRLGAKAREADLKAFSERDALARYRVLHFATHGAIAGDIAGGSEPGLILTPPQTATERDDGYLSASEIAGLKLDADWVILSACNTAAGNADNAEALSGLARAFFYAGTRALLVSHWAVDSDATVKLITQALSTMAADMSIGRAEALRRSMLGLMEAGAWHEAHPAYWAPFVVVGEPAVAR